MKSYNRFIFRLFLVFILISVGYYYAGISKGPDCVEAQTCYPLPDGAEGWIVWGGCYDSGFYNQGSAWGEGVFNPASGGCNCNKGVLKKTGSDYWSGQSRTEEWYICVEAY